MKVQPYYQFRNSAATNRTVCPHNFPFNEISFALKRIAIGHSFIVRLRRNIQRPMIYRWRHERNGRSKKVVCYCGAHPRSPICIAHIKGQMEHVPGVARSGV